MKLFWSSRSPFVRKVMIVAHELGLADQFELVRAVVHPARPNGDVMAFNPLSKIPTLVLDDGAVLYDSRVICDYLDALGGGGGLVPRDGPERWQVLTWQALADGVMETALLWLSERARPEASRQEELIAGCGVKIAAVLDQFDADSAFLAADKPTLGHVALGSALLYLDFRFADVKWRATRPRLRAWSDGFNARASIEATAFADVY